MGDLTERRIVLRALELLLDGRHCDHPCFVSGCPECEGYRARRLLQAEPEPFKCATFAPKEMIPAHVRARMDRDRAAAERRQDAGGL